MSRKCTASNRYRRWGGGSAAAFRLRSTYELEIMSNTGVLNYLAASSTVALQSASETTSIGALLPKAMQVVSPAPRRFE